MAAIIDAEIKPDESTKTDIANDDVEKEKLLLSEYISNLETRIKNKTEMRNENLNCVRPPDSHFSKLDSGLKKNTTFVKKLKSFSATQLDTLLKDFSTLNLTKYISEVAAAIAEAKLKMSDIPAAITLCSSLHRTYVDFSSNFFENWQKLLTFKATDKITNSSKLRVDIRFYAELVAVGIFANKTGLPLLGNVLTVLINMDKEEHNNIPILLSFCKHCGEDYAALVPKKVKEAAEVCVFYDLLYSKFFSFVIFQLLSLFPETQCIYSKKYFPSCRKTNSCPYFTPRLFFVSYKAPDE